MRDLSEMQISMQYSEKIHAPIASQYQKARNWGHSGQGLNLTEWAD